MKILVRITSTSHHILLTNEEHLVTQSWHLQLLLVVKNHEKDAGLSAKGFHQSQGT